MKTIVGTINSAIFSALEQAIADQIVFHKFSELDAPEVLTSISEECQRGDCDHCPGHFEIGLDTIFCVHFCHRIEQEPDSIN